MKFAGLLILTAATIIVLTGCAIQKTPLERTNLCGDWTDGFYVRPNEWFAVEGMETYYYRGKSNMWDPNMVRVDDEGNQVTNLEYKIHLYDLNDKLTKGAAARGDVWRSKLRSCGHGVEKRTDLRLLLQTSQYGLIANGDICSPNPQVAIYYTGQIIQKAGDSTPYAYSDKHKFLANLFMYWQTNDVDIGRSVHSIMVNQCDELPPEISFKGFLRRPVTYQPDRDYNKNRKNVQEAEFRAGTQPTMGRNFIQHEKNKPLPIFDEVYSGKLILAFVGQDVKPPYDPKVDVNYYVLDDDPQIRKFTIDIEIYRLWKLTQEKAKRKQDQIATSSSLSKVFAGLLGMVDGLTLNFADEVGCYLSSSSDRGYENCHREVNRFMASVRSQFPSQYKMGNFAGMIMSPTEDLYPEDMRESAFGRAIIEANEGVLMEYGEGSVDQPFSKERAVENAVIGATAGAAVTTSMKLLK